MDDYLVLNNLFEKNNDKIGFKLSKESNIISINNNNKGDFDKQITFNTQSLASKMINYKEAYILLEIQLHIPYYAGDQGKKTIPKVIYIKNSYELAESLKISLNNVIISNKVNVNRSSLVNFILNNDNKDPIDCRNLKINSSTAEDLNMTDYQFDSKKRIIHYQVKKLMMIQATNFIMSILKSLSI